VRGASPEVVRFAVDMMVSFGLGAAVWNPSCRPLIRGRLLIWRLGNLRQPPQARARARAAQVAFAALVALAARGALAARPAHAPMHAAATLIAKLLGTLTGRDEASDIATIMSRSGARVNYPMRCNTSTAAAMCRLLCHRRGPSRANRRSSRGSARDLDGAPPARFDRELWPSSYTNGRVRMRTPAA
jgi:hypothetical protein